jgi:hypothetical protein
MKNRHRSNAQLIAFAEYQPSAYPLPIIGVGAPVMLWWPAVIPMVALGALLVAMAVR